MCGRTRRIVGLAKETFVVICLNDFVILVNIEDSRCDMLCPQNEIKKSMGHVRQQNTSLGIRIKIAIRCSVCIINILFSLIEKYILYLHFLSSI